VDPEEKMSKQADGIIANIESKGIVTDFGPNLYEFDIYKIIKYQNLFHILLYNKDYCINASNIF
jgi:hypothetical protein